jgi:hypothetical protein
MNPGMMMMIKQKKLREIPIREFNDDTTTPKHRLTSPNTDNKIKELHIALSKIKDFDCIIVNPFTNSYLGQKSRQ